MTIDRAFAMTFTLAVLCEVIRFAFGVLPDIVDLIVFSLGYVLLVALGFMLARGGFGYAVAFANTWPFVLLWFLVGVLNLALGRGETPPGWSAHDQEQAFWGYGLATVMFLPLAFGASATGVWLGRIGRGGRGSTSAA